MYIGKKKNKTFVTNTIPATAFSYTIVVGCMQFVLVYTGSYLSWEICHVATSILQ